MTGHDCSANPGAGISRRTGRTGRRRVTGRAPTPLPAHMVMPAVGLGQQRWQTPAGARAGAWRGRRREIPGRVPQRTKHPCAAQCAGRILGVQEGFWGCRQDYQGADRLPALRSSPCSPPTPYPVLPQKALLPWQPCCQVTFPKAAGRKAQEGTFSNGFSVRLSDTNCDIPDLPPAREQTSAAPNAHSPTQHTDTWSLLSLYTQVFCPNIFLQTEKCVYSLNLFTCSLNAPQSQGYAVPVPLGGVQVPARAAVNHSVFTTPLTAVPSLLVF